jgi:hypothetical protein
MGAYKIDIRGRLTRVGLWLDESPGLEVVRRNWVELSVKSSARESIAGSAAVELWSRRGPRASYGLVAGHFVPRPSGGVVVRIAAGTREDHPLSARLKGAFGRFYLGLPEEFLDGVLSGVRAGASALGPGILILDRFIHCQMASAPSVFERLAQAVCGILALPHDADRRRKAIDLIKTGFRP